MKKSRNVIPVIIMFYMHKRLRAGRQAGGREDMQVSRNNVQLLSCSPCFKHLLLH